MKRLTIEEFINRSNKIHGIGKYGYDKVKFNSCKDYVTIICHTHGEFDQMAETHYMGKGCKECGIIKQKETLMKNYGVDNPFKSKVIQDEIQVTMGEKYGGIGMNSPILKKKIEQTNLERYGVSNPFESKELMGESLKNRDYVEIHKKIQETVFNKYGVTSILASKDCQDKMLLDTRTRMLDSIFKGNRTNNTSIPLFAPEEYTDVKKQYRWKCNKCNSEFYDDLDDGKTPKCNICYPPFASIPETEFLDYLNIPIRNHRLTEWKQKPIDGYDDKTNTVYEFLGDYWHGNPNTLNKNDINQTTGDTFEKLYNDTIMMFDKLQSFGCIVKYIWENDWKSWIKSGKLGECPVKTYKLKCPI